VARVCKTIHSVTIRVLYRVVSFRLPLNISEVDTLLAQFETFIEPHFSFLKYTISMIVSGTWYGAYDELESALGRGGLLSPAVRMLNVLIALCLQRSDNVKAFT
jgi:hypothetical protein